MHCISGGYFLVACLFGSSFTMSWLFYFGFPVLLWYWCSIIVSVFSVVKFWTNILVVYQIPYGIFHFTIFLSTLFMEVFNVTLLGLWSLGWSSFYSPVNLIHYIQVLLLVPYFTWLLKQVYVLTVINNRGYYKSIFVSLLTLHFYLVTF